MRTLSAIFVKKSEKILFQPIRALELINFVNKIEITTAHALPRIAIAVTRTIT